MRTHLLFAAALGAPLVVHAAPPDATSVQSVVITATQLPIELTDTPDARVIDRTDIDARQATFAADILTAVPGLALTRVGAFGGVTSVRMRGASSDKTLVLIDGVPQNDASQPSGAYDFSHLDLADIERVEILSGPQGSIWGSDAIGGVIAFTTRELDGWRAAAEGGSLATFDGSAGIGRRTETWALGASVAGYRSDGISKADGFAERDGETSWTAGAYGRWTPSAKVSLDARFRYTDDRVDDDGYNPATGFTFGDTPEFDRTHTWTASGRAILQGPWGFTHTLTLGAFAIARDHVFPGQPFSSSAYWAWRQDYRWLAERGAPSDAFGAAFGVERQADRASLSTGQRLNLGTTSGFALARWRPWASLTLTGAGRYDAPDTAAGQATGRVGAVLKLPAGLSLEAAWGQGFKTPTISELACDFCFPAGASVGLKPEHAEGEDVALAWRSADGRFYARVTGYRLDVRDQIQFSAAFPFRYFNLDRTRTVGLEAEADAKITDQLSLEAGYAYTDARDVGAGTAQLRVPRNAGSIALFWHDGRWQAALSLRAEGSDADEDPSTFIPTPRPGFAVANLTGSYQLEPGLELTARVENLADAHYQEVLGYGEPRRMFFVGLRAKG